jgi:hypothetical protein
MEAEGGVPGVLNLQSFDFVRYEGKVRNVDKSPLNLPNREPQTFSIFTSRPLGHEG